MTVSLHWTDFSSVYTKCDCDATSNTVLNESNELIQGTKWLGRHIDSWWIALQFVHMMLISWFGKMLILGKSARLKTQRKKELVGIPTLESGYSYLTLHLVTEANAQICHIRTHELSDNDWQMQSIRAFLLWSLILKSPLSNSGEIEHDITAMNGIIELSVTPNIFCSSRYQSVYWRSSMIVRTLSSKWCFCVPNKSKLNVRKLQFSSPNTCIGNRSLGASLGYMACEIASIIRFSFHRLLGRAYMSWSEPPIIWAVFCKRVILRGVSLAAFCKCLNRVSQISPHILFISYLNTPWTALVLVRHDSYPSRK